MTLITLDMTLPYLNQTVENKEMKCECNSLLKESLISKGRTGKNQIAGIVLNSNLLLFHLDKILLMKENLPTVARFCSIIY